jgi:flagellar hook-associated protein 3
MLNNTMMRNLNNSLARLDRLQDMLASGKKVSRPSDDPVVAVNGMRYRTTLNENEQFRRNSNQAMNWLDSSESAVSEAKDVLHRVSDLVTQAANDTLSDGDREKIRAELIQLREHLGNIANTTQGGRYLFGGTDTVTPPYGEIKLDPPRVDPNDTKDLDQDRRIDQDKLPYASSSGYVNKNRENIEMELSQQSYLPVNVDGVPLFGQSNDNLVPADGVPLLSQGFVKVETVSGTRGANELKAGDKLTFTFDKDLDAASQADIQTALQDAFGAGNVNITPAPAPDNNKAFIVEVTAANIDISTEPGLNKGIVTISKDKIKYADGTTADIDMNFAVSNKETPTAPPMDAKSFKDQLVAQDQAWKTDLFGTLDKIINELKPSPYMTDKYGRILAGTKKDANGNQKPLTEVKTMIVDGKEVSYIAYKLYDPKDPNQYPLLKSADQLKPKGKELTGYIDIVKGHMDNFLQAQSSIGSRMNRIELIQNRLDTQHDGVERMMSDEEDADMARVIMDLQNSENVHRAALASGSRIIQPTLLDFLR